MASADHSSDHPADHYYVPHHSRWPFLGSIGLFLTMVGFANWVNGNDWGRMAFFAGLLSVLLVLFFWFGNVIAESLSGKYNGQVDVSFRMGMMWFIFSEVMFFAAFFGALFYVRNFALPWWSGEGDGALTNLYLYNGYAAGWPSNGPGATIALGAAFLFFQATEYHEAYTELNLTLGSGIYGSTFFMLTGFHGMHVTLGAIMLSVIWLRCANGHFSKDHHFAFEAVAWYWHFVDVVWLGLFLFVYVL